jgi:hypothetical protein
LIDAASSCHRCFDLSWCVMAVTQRPIVQIRQSAFVGTSETLEDEDFNVNGSMRVVCWFRREHQNCDGCQYVVLVKYVAWGVTLRLTRTFWTRDWNPPLNWTLYPGNSTPISTTNRPSPSPLLRRRCKTCTTDIYTPLKLGWRLCNRGLPCFATGNVLPFQMGIQARRMTSTVAGGTVMNEAWRWSRSSNQVGDRCSSSRYLRDEWKERRQNNQEFVWTGVQTLISTVSVHIIFILMH